MNIKLFYALAALSLSAACQQHTSSTATAAKDTLVKNDTAQKTALIASDTLQANVKIDCTDKGGDMENGFLQECVFHTADLNEAYRLYRRRNADNDDGKYLEQELPKTDTTKIHEESQITVKYTYSNIKSLTIDLLFPGGETSITLTKDEATIKISTLHSPD